MSESYEGIRSRSTDLGSYTVCESDLGFKICLSRSPKWTPQRRERLIVFSIFLLYLMIALDSTIIVPVLPTIASDLNGTAVEAVWAGTSFLLTYAIFQPFIAAVSDIFGRREVMLASVSLFTAGSLIACLAQNFSMLLTGRSIQGVGAGGVFVLGYVILTDIVPLRQRPKFTAIIQIAWAIGTILGPLFGGIFAEHSTWRWTFYINFPFCAIGFVMVPIAVRLKRQESTLIYKIKQVDWIGGSLFIISTTLLLIAISWGGTQFAWDHIATFAPMILGIFGTLYTIWYEFQIANVPFLRKGLFYCRSAIAAYICSLIQGLELYIALYYIPLYFQAVKGLSPILTGISALPITSSLVPSSVFVEGIIARTGRFRLAIWMGWVLTTISTGLLLLLNTNTKTAVWSTVLILLGVGHGLVLSALNLGVQAISTVNNVAHAVAMYSFLRAVGAALGVGMGGTVFQNAMSKRLSVLGLPTNIAKNAEAYIEVLHTLPANSFFKINIIECYVTGIQGVFTVMTGFSGLAMFLSFLIAKHSMDKDLEDESVSIEYKKPLPDRPMIKAPTLINPALPAPAYMANSSDNYLDTFDFEDCEPQKPYFVAHSAPQTLRTCACTYRGYVPFSSATGTRI
ncbi:MFS multidrug transporter [Histoplasma ohiense]|nr:MFS multidrug transporter [Histoplasma ohiense (nom. inval.)]